MFPFTTISIARSVRNVFITERANETDWDDHRGVDDSDKIPLAYSTKLIDVTTVIVLPNLVLIW